MWVISSSSPGNTTVLCGKTLSPLWSLSILMGTPLGVGSLDFEPYEYNCVMWYNFIALVVFSGSHGDYSRCGWSRVRVMGI